MHVAVYVLHGVIDHLMRILTLKSIVGLQRSTVESRSSFDMLADFRVNRALLAVRGDRGYFAILAILAILAALKDAHDRDLVFSAGASDAPCAFAGVHVAGFAADESFIRLNVAGHFLASVHPQRETDAMVH
jgi:hypothetical protein